jgi:hypothetical protein
VTDHQILPAGAGHLLTARGNVMAFKAVAAQTGGDFSLMERTLPPGARRPPAHRHVNCSEAFFRVIEGPGFAAAAINRPGKADNVKILVETAED